MHQSSIIIVHPPRIKSYRHTGSVIHPSVSQSISHPSIQSASAASGWSNQSGQVMWVMKRKRQIYRNPQWWPTHHPSMTHFIALSFFCLHSPVSLFSLSPHCLDSSLQEMESGLSRDNRNYCQWLWFLLLCLCLVFIHSFLDSRHERSCEEISTATDFCVVVHKYCFPALAVQYLWLNYNDFCCSVKTEKQIV